MGIFSLPQLAKGHQQMSEFPAEGSEDGEMASVLENLQKKNRVVNRLNSSQAAFNNEVASSSQMLSSSSSRVAKRSQLMHHMTSSEMKSSSSSSSSKMKSDLSELKSSISEMKNLSEMKSSAAQMMTTQSETSRNFSRSVSAASSASSNLAVTSSTNMAVSAANATNNFLRNSMENLEMGEEDMPEPLVTFPDPETPPVPTSALTSPNLVNSMALATSPNLAVANSSSAAVANASEMKFEQKRVTSASKTKVVTDSFSSEQATANSAEMKRVQAGEMTYEEKSAAAAMRARLEIDGVTAEKAATMKQEQRSLKAGEVTQQETQNMAAASMKLQTDSFTAEKKAMAAQQQRHTVTSSGIFNQEKHMAASSQSNITITAKGVCTKSSASSMMAQSSQMSQLINGTILSIEDDNFNNITFEDLESLNADSNQQEVEKAKAKYSSYFNSYVQTLKKMNEMKAPKLLNQMNEVIRKAWAVPTHGHELGYSLCNILRNYGGLDILIRNCIVDNSELQFSSARLLEQCLITENRAYVVEKGLDKVVNVACVCTKNKNVNSVEHSRVGTGILEHLFKHSEGTCSDVIKLGGLDAVLFECRKNDIETLRHCAGALANLSLYGGAENQEAMIKRQVPVWLYPLAFHNDDNIKYYACLAIAVLVANKEIEAAVLQSGTLDLVEPFVTSHNPSEFAKSNLAHAHGQSKNWLQRLVPILSSKREEARNLAAFHFCMEAGIKKQQGKTELFREIGAIEPLKKVASCPNAVASKYAAQALRLIGEEVPHKLSQQVPLWSSEDVREWVKQIGFSEYADNFVESRVDGDLLLQLTEENLRDDIGITNGIRRRRFTRELQNLKKMADYSSRDSGQLNSFLQSIGPDFSIYTYTMLNAGVDKESIRCLSDDQLLRECGISNSIHRLRILDSIREMKTGFADSSEENLGKTLDCFVSYRRSNGSQLASLLKVHLQLRRFSVFIDVERLEAGKFDNNLLQSIRQAKNFLLVLTPNALDRCVADHDCKDWVHREVVEALQSNCNIIPIIDNFQWPEPEELPEDMRAVCYFNGVRWIHDYQEACVDKVERFIRGEANVRSDGHLGRFAGVRGDATPGTPSAVGRHPYQRMHSNESGKGSACSDKDINGNSGGGGGGRD